MVMCEYVTLYLTSLSNLDGSMDTIPQARKKEFDMAKLIPPRPG